MRAESAQLPHSVAANCSKMGWGRRCGRRSSAAALRGWRLPMSWRRRARRARRSSTRCLRRASGWAARWPRRSWMARCWSAGPDSFLTEKPAAAELCRELGLGAELMPSNDAGAQDLHCGAQPAGAAARRPDVPGAHQADSHGADAALQLRHQDPHGAGTAASAAAQRSGRSRWRRWSSGTLARRPWTGWPIRCCRGIYGGDATQLSARTVLPRLVEMETRIRLADARHAGRAPQDARQGGESCASGRRQRRAGQAAAGRGAVDLYRAARRHAAAGRCA